MNVSFVLSICSSDVLDLQATAYIAGTATTQLHHVLLGVLEEY